MVKTDIIRTIEDDDDVEDFSEDSDEEVEVIKCNKISNMHC